ncbi:MAG: formyltransferase family protein [Solirubrobacterales bacterium]
MKLVIFTDVNAPVTAGLIEATLRLARDGNGVEVGAFVTSRPDDFRSRRRDHSIDLFREARRHGVPVLVPPTGDPNDPAFRTMLAEEVKGDVALSYFALRIFRRPLLDTFEQAINFHNSLLPDYKGVMATSFSMYFGEPRTGYSYFSLRDLEETTGIEHPERLSAQELQRRVRSFGLVYITIGGEPRPVTRLEPAGSDRPLAFRTADGRMLAPVGPDGGGRILRRLLRRRSADA